MNLFEGKKDCSGYINVGELDYNVSRNAKKLYVMVSPEKIQKWGNLEYDVVYTQNPDGTGTFALDYMNIKWRTIGKK